MKVYTGSTGEYPPEWVSGEIQREVYAAANWHCEHCAMEFIPGSTIAVSARRRDGRPMILTVHHIDGNKSDCSPTNLVALCQRCHLYVQYRWRPGEYLPSKWRTVPGWIVARGLAYREWDQLDLALDFSDERLENGNA